MGDVAIFATCYGVLGSDSNFDPRGGLLQGFIETGRQVITSYRAIELDPASILGACLLADRGVPFGLIVDFLNQTATERGEHESPPWLLIGNPNARLEAERSPLDALDSFSRAHAGIASCDSSGPRRVVLADCAHGSDGTMWLAPVPATPYVVWLHDCPADGSSDTIRVLETPVTDDTQRSLQRIWQSGPRIAFTHDFLTRAIDSPVLTGYDYPAPFRDVVASVKSRIMSLEAVSKLGVSGQRNAIRELAAAEGEILERVNSGLHEIFVSYFKSGGGVLDHGYLNAAQQILDEAPIPCGYCAGAALVRRVVLGPGVSARRIITCPRCTVVCDVDSDTGSVWILGPSVIRTGEEVEFKVRLSGGTAGAVEYGRACALLQPIPNIPDNCGDTIVFGYGYSPDQGDARVTWHAPETLHDGMYFMLVPIVSDGGLQLGRRPILIQGG